MNKTLTFKTTTKLFSALAFLLLGATSCSKKNEVTGTSYVQVTNASEADSPFDFYVDATKETTTPLAYTQSSAYVSVSSGDHPAAFKTASNGVNLTAFTITPQPGLYYSIFYFGGTTVAMQDDLSAPATGKARVRFINLNPGVPTAVDFAVAGGATLASKLSLAVNSDYFNADPATTFSALSTGTTTELIHITTAIEAGHIYTIYLSGTLQADLQATVLLQK
ncbi:DUF4397 domain-containing protein [Mucilaginibacter sp. dw_454]|uniref:DUF4397 domain-containing protein n=1 Tax=Mucilaginibacter sp. dw_454 TaxID=2720079 RepID=UPI001BD57E56|nr:DUF4397 domain-containing protein [Mucilaginibacter sp. dw_454]